MLPAAAALEDDPEDDRSPSPSDEEEEDELELPQAASRAGRRAGRGEATGPPGNCCPARSNEAFPGRHDARSCVTPVAI